MKTLRDLGFIAYHLAIIALCFYENPKITAVCLLVVFAYFCGKESASK